MFTFQSRVIKGAGFGRTIGFPTLNLEIPLDFSLEYGVYAVCVQIRDKLYLGALHYGSKFSFPLHTANSHIREPSLEVFVLDFSGTVDSLKVNIIQRLREVRTFKTSFDLQKQIAFDVESVRKLREILREVA